MNLVTLKVNNKEITVQENTLILDAAKEAGFDIPTFCYQANLSGLGSCRMCLIEIEGQKKLQPSCITPVMPNMSVLTDSAQVLSARGAMLEFFLTNHALDCPVCDKGGECELQNLVHKHGPRKGRFGEIKTKFHEKDYALSPVIVKNSNRCVQCMRCVRVCSEVVGRNVLGTLGRGAYQEETSFFKTTLDCDHDGMCIEVCPVGCFMRLPYRYKARPWDLKGASTVCPYCATGCTLMVEKRQDEAVRAIARPNNGFNNKMLCARGRFGYDILNNRDRLTTPLVKKGSRFEPISWDKALGIIRDRLFKSTPEKIAAIASPTLTNEEFYLLQKLMRCVLKTGNMDSTSRWNESATAAFIGATGIPAGPTDVYDCMNADTIFVVGGHISDENPVTDYIVRYLSRMRRKTLITAGPRSLKLDSSALIRLRHLPGRLSTLLSAVTSSLKGENIEARPAFGGCPVDCGANIEDIRLTAETFKRSKAISIMVGTDFLRFRQGAYALKILSDCLMALGCEVKILPLLDRCNQRGAWDMGVHPSFTPGYGTVAGGWLGCDGILDAAQKGTIDALYVLGEDIVSMRPDMDFTINVLSKAGFLIVEECFLTDTAKLADIILPGALPAEKTGTFTNQEGRIQRLNPLKSPPGEAKTDFEIISLIGGMLGHGFLGLSPQDIMKEIAKNVASYSQISGEGSFVKATNKAIEISQDEIKIDLGKDTSYPYLLITGNHLLHSGSLSMRSDILKGLLPEPTVEISKDTADLLGVKDGDYVIVKGKDHEARFSLRTNPGTVKDVVFIPENFPLTQIGRFFKKGESVARVDIIPCKH